VADLNSYASGNCTWWAKNQAPWVPNGWGNAAEWFPRAQQSGYGTSQSPRVGALAVWGPGVDPPWGFGHVALVKGVQPDGSFTVSEMNWKGLGVVDTRNVTERSNLLGFILPPGSRGDSSAQLGQAAGPDPFGLSQATGQLVSAGQVAGGALLVVAALGVAFLLLRR